MMHGADVMKKKVTAIIPARMESSRFPGKPLTMISNLPMIEHVRRRTCLSRIVDEVYVATCNPEIVQVVERYGGRAIMTADSHLRCTDRVEEAIRDISSDIVINVQGDEPLLDPDMLDLLVEPLLKREEIKCSNILSIIHKRSDLSNADIVKAIVNSKGNIMYYSRSPIPFFMKESDAVLYRQTGLAAFTKEFLQLYSSLTPTPMEQTESVDFLRILEHDYPILGVIVNRGTVGVDRPGDVAKVEAVLKEDPRQKKLHEECMNQ